jgi:hypothetical protein
LPKTPVFISWSGLYANEVAVALKSLLDDVLHELDIFVSSEDIEAGTNWAEEIRARLQNAKVGILCITKDKLDSRWLNYEAGAMANAKGEKRVIPYCVGMEVGAIGTPLNQLQAVPADRKGTRALIEAVNNACGEFKLDDNKLDRLFDKMYVDFEASYKAATARQANRQGSPVTVFKPTTDERLTSIEEKLALIVSRLDSDPMLSSKSALYEEWEERQVAYTDMMDALLSSMTSHLPEEKQVLFREQALNQVLALVVEPMSLRRARLRIKEILEKVIEDDIPF